MRYEPTIGLEIHAELNTATKMFCRSLNDPHERHPNINICPVCVGHPGTLPVPNKKAILEVLRVGYALNCTIADVSKFDRKNYFYPDLPKGYQISQYDMPFCRDGYMELPYSDNKVRVERIHLEEDTGRLQHDEKTKRSLVDFNRAGIPLMELVTRPDIHEAKDARLFAEELQRILRYLKASHANMEKGEMRVEVNLSLAKKGAKKLGTKVEVKNLNSFRVVEDAIAYETERQAKVLDEGGKVRQETRGWDDIKKQTVSQRSKEEAHDYRYFPEPDIPTLRIDKESGFDKEALKASLPELPAGKRKRFQSTFGLTPPTLEIFVNDPALADFYENSLSELEAQKGGKNEFDLARAKDLTLNYLLNALRALMQDGGGAIKDLRITPEHFADFIVSVADGVISSTGAKEVLGQMYKSGEDPHHIINKGNFAQMEDDSALESIVLLVLTENPGPVGEYKKGKKETLQFLVGQVMAKTKGRANPQSASEILAKLLKS